STKIFSIAASTFRCCGCGANWRQTRRRHVSSRPNAASAMSLQFPSNKAVGRISWRAAQRGRSECRCRISECGWPLPYRFPDADAQGYRPPVHAAMKRVALSGFADPRVSESVHLDDPEGNGAEVLADRDPSLWQ